MPEAVEAEDWLQLAAAALALVLLAVAALAWRRRPTPRTLLVAVAFGLFALRGVLLVLADFVVAAATGDLLESLAVPLEVAFLVLVTVALLRG